MKHVIFEYIAYCNDPNNADAIADADEDSKRWEGEMGISCWPSIFPFFFNNIVNALQFEKEHPEILDVWMDGKTLEERLNEANLPSLESVENKAKQVAEVYQLINGAGHPVRDGMLLCCAAKGWVMRGIKPVSTTKGV